MTAPAPIRYDPGEPETGGVCAGCAERDAHMAVWDATDDLVGGRAFPKDDEREFRDRFGPALNDMADWVAERARVAALKDDNEWCDEHRPTKEDES